MVEIGRTGHCPANLPEEAIGDFVPPPRTITDIAALLEQHEQTNAAELACRAASSASIVYVGVSRA